MCLISLLGICLGIAGAVMGNERLFELGLLLIIVGGLGGAYMVRQR